MSDPIKVTVGNGLTIRRVTTREIVALGSTVPGPVGPVGPVTVEAAPVHPV